MVTSSPITAAAVGVSGEVAGDLLTALDAVADPRPGGFRWHPTRYVLAVLVSAFASAGFGSLTGAAHWAAGAGAGLLRGLGARPDPFTGQVYPPSEATIRRVASAVDAAELEAVIAAWTAAHTPGPDPDAPAPGRLAVAIDGKTVRGARSPGRVTPRPRSWPRSATSSSTPYAKPEPPTSLPPAKPSPSTRQPSGGSSRQGRTRTYLRCD